MPKQTPVSHPIHDLLRDRWSPRAYAERSVDAAVLRSLFEAARWAASSYNDQPWSFILARREEPDAYARMLACVRITNQRWAARAPVLMVSLARTRFAANGEVNLHAWHDVGMASAAIAVQATSLDLHMRMIAGIDRDKTRDEYQLPADVEPVAGIALGYIGALEDLPEDLRARELAPRDRRPQSTFVFHGRFGEAWTE